MKPDSLYVLLMTSKFKGLIDLMMIIDFKWIDAFFIIWIFCNIIISMSYCMIFDMCNIWIAISPVSGNIFFSQFHILMIGLAYSFLSKCHICHFSHRFKSKWMAQRLYLFALCHDFILSFYYSQKVFRFHFSKYSKHFGESKTEMHNRIFFF